MYFFILYVYVVSTVSKVCSHGSVRLVDGRTNYTGRLEICINGVWGTVCNDNQWRRYGNARIACRQMNLPGGRKYSDILILHCSFYIIYYSI